MKIKNYKQILVVIIVSVFIVPQIVSAAWWNPLSWGIFHRTNTQTQVLENHKIESDNKLITATTTISTSTPPAVIITTQQKYKKPIPPKLSAITPKVTPKVIVKQNITVTATSSTKIISPSVVAIDAFLANPTVENFKLFCSLAKTLQGTGESKVLNENRTDYVMKKNTLYNNVSECAQALGEYKKTNGQQILINWFTYNASDLFSLDNSSESDSVRKVKINFNSYWKSISKYKLIGISYIPENGVATLNQQKELIIPGSVGMNNIYGSERRIAQLFIVPEQILSSIKTVLVSR